MSYENSNPIPDKFLFLDGSIRQLDGTVIQQSTEFGIKKYNQSSPIPNKFLYSDGGVKDREGNVIEEATEWRKKQYEQSAPIPAKFLKPDGTVDENIGSGGTPVKYKLYAYECDSIPDSFGYTEKENPIVGDVLLLPENIGSGAISDPTELKQVFTITEVHEDGTIYARKNEGDSPIHLTRSEENDYEETITDIRGTSDISSSGLTVASKGTVFKAINIE